MSKSTETRMSQIDSSPRLQNVKVEHCFVLDPSEWSQGQVVDNIGFSNKVCDSLFHRLSKLISAFRPDAILIHGAQVFTAAGEYRLRDMFSRLMERHAGIRFVLPMKDFILDWLANNRTKPRPRFHPSDPVVPGKPRDKELEAWIDQHFVKNSDIEGLDALIGMV